MKKIILKYGLLSAAVLLILTVISFLSLGTAPENYDIGEVIGYSSIVASLLFIYFGMKEYNSLHPAEHLSFLKAFKLGILISIAPAIIFGLYNYVYIEFLDPNFIENYYAHQTAKLKANLSSQEFNTQKLILDEQKELFHSPAFQFGIMFLTVWIMGAFISLFSALIVYNKKQ